MFTFSIKRESTKFHVVVVQQRQRNVQKKCAARAKLLFCHSKPIAFFAVFVAVAVVIVQAPYPCY